MSGANDANINSCRKVSDTTLECDAVFDSGATSTGQWTVSGSTISSAAYTGNLGSDGKITWYDNTTGAFFGVWTRV